MDPRSEALGPRHRQLEHELMLALQGGEGAPGAPGAGAAGESFRIGAYRVISRLGQGGMATVFLAEHEQLGRRVAIKVVRPGLRFLGEAHERFRREARAASRLDHPGICHLYEVGEADDVAFMAMQLVEGETLGQKLARLRAGGAEDLLPGATARDRVLALVQLTEKAARALHFAHEQGVIHRDIKPSNIMVTPSGDPMILDFGVAFDERGTDQSLTLTGQLVGTPMYMSPEQVDPRERMPDPRTDVYSLGVTLYECLTLYQPFAAATQHEIYQRILRVAAPDPRRANPAISRDLQVVLATAMEKDPERRYHSALELAEDLRRVREHEPIHARPAGPVLRVRRWVQRNPLASAFIVALVLFAGTSLLLYGSAQRNLERFNLVATSVKLEEAVAKRETLYPSNPEMAGPLRTWLAEHADPLVTRLPALESALATTAAGSGDDTELFLAKTLGSLVTELRGFREHLPRVRERLIWCENVERLSLVEPREEWAHAIASIGDPTECPMYAGLRIRPQRGLVPIGRDPGSGLWEFVHLESGERPTRDEAGHLRIGEKTGIVLVLIPGGRFFMGEEKQYAYEISNGTQKKTDSSPDEWPRHEAEVAAFFISKYEMTQAQWLRATGTNPSRYSPDRVSRSLEGKLEPATWMHPVEYVSWWDCDQTLSRMELCLPGEAQWEYAARAGTDTPWWTGTVLLALAKADNLLDQDGADMGLVAGGKPAGWNDGFGHHAPIGMFRPNPFGLHDIHGNVQEWCADAGVRYPTAGSGVGAREPRSKPATRGQSSSAPGSPPHEELPRVVRGGSFYSLLDRARSSSRLYVPALNTNETVGVRPARVIQP